MSIELIEGKWIGKVSYGDTYPWLYRLKTLSFSLDLKEENGLVTGTCEDELTKQFKLPPATIEGSYQDEVFHFIKYYSCFITLNEHGKLVADENMPSSIIQYEGKIHYKLFSKQPFFKGEWDISGSFLDENNEPLYYTMGGKWKLQRI